VTRSEAQGSKECSLVTSHQSSSSKACREINDAEMAKQAICIYISILR